MRECAARSSGFRGLDYRPPEKLRQDIPDNEVAQGLYPRYPARDMGLVPQLAEWYVFQQARCTVLNITVQGAIIWRDLRL